MTLFGPAGNSDIFTKKYKGSVYAPAWLREMGLDCFEYQCGRGVNIGEDTARAIGAAAAQSGIRMSVHAPYFINLSHIEPERLDKNLGYILQAARAALWMGGDRIVVHCGGLSGMTREEALSNTEIGLRRALELLETEKLSGVTLCVETMGKINMLGDLSEVLSLCRTDERLLPCIDFGHLNARTQGQVRTKEQIERVFTEIENELGKERAKRLHAHVSRIEYGRGGEVRHLTFADTVYGPDYELVTEQLAKRGYDARVICESAGTQAEDALKMKRSYLNYLK